MHTHHIYYIEYVVFPQWCGLQHAIEYYAHTFAQTYVRTKHIPHIIKKKQKQIEKREEVKKQNTEKKRKLL